MGVAEFFPGLRRMMAAQWAPPGLKRRLIRDRMSRITEMNERIFVVLLGLCVWAALAQPVAIQGIVLRDDTGEAVPWADIRVSRAGSRYLEAHLESGQAGQFGAEGLPEGSYTLTVEKRGFLSTRLPVEDPDQPLAIRLVRAGSISGRILNQQGQPFLKARVALMERSQGGALRHVGRDAQAQPDGTYRFTGLRPGRYLLLASFEGEPGESFSILYPSTAKPEVLAITGGEDYPNRDFIGEVGAAFRVSGRIERPADIAPAASTGDGGRPAPPRRESVALSLVDEPGIIVAWALTGQDGSFAFPAIPWGSYTLHAAGPVTGYGGTSSILARDAKLSFAQMPIEVSGERKGLSLPLEEPRSLRLFLEADVAGQAACPSSLDASLAPLEAWGAMLQRTVKLVAGKVVMVENLAPARYVLSPGRTGADGCQVRLAQPIDLRSASPAEPVRVKASASGSIIGSIVDPPAGSRLQVLLLPLDVKAAVAGSPSGALRVTASGGDGAFRFDEVPPGRYALHVHSPGSGAARNWFRDTGSLVEVEVIGGVVEVALYAPVEPPR